MEVFEIIIAMLLGGAALAAMARRFGAPYPALAALAGAGMALIPGVPTLVLDPELALALFVAPVLSDAAFDASPRDLRANWRSVTSLALGAVALTIVVVALVAKALVPGLPWGAAIALGAIVAPPDAAAATTVLKQLRPPNRLLVILEGESLFNDASSLLVYRLAVGATIAGFFSGWSVLPTLLVVTIGSIVLALILARLSLAINKRISDVATSVVFQFCGSFGVWVLAEQLHLSGIITLVVFAMVASRRAPAIMPARLRVPSWAVWEVAVFVLNVLAFILVGFQLKAIAERLDRSMWAWYALVAVVVCVVVMLARLAWVSGPAVFRRWHTHAQQPDAFGLSARNAAVIGWCGMRGTVTLATALALPTGGEGNAAFPYRDLIIVTAFGVVVGTLVFQGLTLRPLITRLRLRDDGAIDREIHMARVETLRAAIAAVEAYPEAETAMLVRYRYAFQLRRAERELAPNTTDTDNLVSPSSTTSSVSSYTNDNDADELVMRATTEAQRQRLIALRANGTIGDAAFQRVEEELDWAEINWAQLLQVGQRTGTET